MSNPYDMTKAAWHLEDIQTLRAGGHIPPRHVQLIISDLCNQNCSFCAYRMDGGFSSENFGDYNSHGWTKNPNRKIPTEKCFQILEDCWEVGVKAIQFTGGGEPTVHPDHDAIFKKAQELGLQTALVSNGTTLPSKEVLEGMSWIRISLDAGEEKTYFKIRESKSWKKVLEHLDVFGTLRNPLVGVGFVITDSNWREISKACEIVKDSGIRYIRLSAMFSSFGSDHYQGIYSFILQEIEKAKLLQDEEFKIYDLFSHRLGDLNQGSPKNSYCGYQRFTLYIAGNQKVYRCCTTSYTNQGEIGDLTNLRFAQWWRETAQSMYEGFDAKTCHHCQFNTQNESLNSLIRDEPLHVDFV